MAEHVEVRRGSYADSVTLMQVSRDVSSVGGVETAMVAMATPLNLELLEDMGFEVPEASPTDMVVAVRVRDGLDSAIGLEAVESALAAASSGPMVGVEEDVAARTTGSALRRGDDAGLVLVSVPGQYAFAEAMDALQAGRHVMVFSDNVPVEQEVRIKTEADRRGLLVMGPDCGTAVVGGLGLGFANAVRPGPVGIVAASGTGCQQLLALLDAAGAGVSAALGVGGRDLSAAIGGLATRQALRMLDADPATERIVVISKPPAPDVAAALEDHAASLGTPVQWALLGPGRPDLTVAAEELLTTLGYDVPTWPTWGVPSRRDCTSGRPDVQSRRGKMGLLRGLFCGGTLCDEAMLLTTDELGPVRSNIPLSPELALDESLTAGGHLMIDFGDDRLTAGRAHPMIDPTLRLEHLAEHAADPATGVLLLDVVLGHAAHPDPAADLAPAIRSARAAAAEQGRDLPVVVSCIGTTADPQDLHRQAEALAAAGAWVFASNAQATRAALALLTGHAPHSRAEIAEVADRRSTTSAISARKERPDVQSRREGLLDEPSIVAVGADLLADSIAAQAGRVRRVEWRPPMPGTGNDLATVAADPLRENANAEAVRRVLGTQAMLVDVVPASEALGLSPGDFLHAGPPVTWELAAGPLRGALMGACALEGLAERPEDAVPLLESGRGVTLDPCHHHGAVGPMAGVVSASMWMFVLEDADTGRRTYCSLNEGLGKVLRYGAYGPDVLDRLRWMGRVLGPLLQYAVRETGPVDVTGILTQMLQMGDEAHNRNRAGTLMLMRDLVPAMIASGTPGDDIADAVRFIGNNDHFFLNLAMPTCKLALDAARDIEGSTMVVAMARNGTDFGIQVAGTGNTWFTAPAEIPDGLYLGDFGPDDANPDIGDSAIAETAGLGGFAMAAAPAIVRFVGGSVPDALSTTRRMYEITLAESSRWTIPALEFRGVPTGIDVTAVARTGILPQINTGMAGKVAGTGQVGAGLVTPPAEVFTQAVAALAAATRARTVGP
ncbi:MAG: acyl-CoA synthetase FdrA [Propionibacteriales bacterium]|nr:acyl-CoA synthetase FdrA [Propionibacteriales bacterium]